MNGLPGGNGAPVIPLVIVLDPRTNSVSIAEGPLENYLVCFGMLELARAILLKKLHAQMDPKRVVPGHLTDLDGLIDPPRG